MLSRCSWLNEPASWRCADDILTVVTDRDTDFWRHTHYGFTRDSGHVFGLAVRSGFTAQVRVAAAYDHLYDQAGLMVRIDERRWIKAGIEWSDGVAMLGSVLTMDRSDWATAPCPFDPSDIWMRVTVDRGVLRLQASPDGQRWTLCRLAPFADAEGMLVGPMCCTPQRAGLEVRFSEFRVGPPLDKELHDPT